MTITTIVGAIQFVCLGYFLIFTLSYLALNAISLRSVLRYRADRTLGTFPSKHSGLEPPITILVPAFNEETTIVATIRSLLQLTYAEYEVMVINDGSTDQTMDVLIKEFSLVRSLLPIRKLLQTRPIREVYRSTVFRQLRVIDKENGGKSDALNAGINVSFYPLFCCIDADSILKRDSLRHVVQPFMEDPTVVASGGTVRVANGCEVLGGLMTKMALPKSPLALFQIVEYLRAFLFGRVGWSTFNALLIISGAFGLFRKETVIAAGGYSTDTIGEDFELVVRLHRHLKLSGKPYRISYVPDPVCWTEVPEDLKTLKNQRIRWQRGLLEGLIRNKALLFHRKGGVVGWLAFPFMFFLEGLGPFVEVFGYASVTLGYGFGVLSFEAFGAFFLVAIGSGLVLSFNGLLLEAVGFRIYSHPAQFSLLMLVCIAENFGYRQLTAVWRTIGNLRWLVGKKAVWGEMKRTAAWQTK